MDNGIRAVQEHTAESDLGIDFCLADSGILRWLQTRKMSKKQVIALDESNFLEAGELCESLQD